jgi:hypothetical protein
MARAKNSSRPIHVYIEAPALEALRAEVQRLSTRPGKLLSKLIKERAASFYSHPVQLIEK